MKAKRRAKWRENKTKKKRKLLSEKSIYILSCIITYTSRSLSHLFMHIMSQCVAKGHFMRMSLYCKLFFRRKTSGASDESKGMRNWGGWWCCKQASSYFRTQDSFQDGYLQPTTMITTTMTTTTRTFIWLRAQSIAVFNINLVVTRILLVMQLSG